MKYAVKIYNIDVRVPKMRGTPSQSDGNHNGRKYPAPLWPHNSLQEHNGHLRRGGNKFLNDYLSATYLEALSSSELSQYYYYGSYRMLESLNVEEDYIGFHVLPTDFSQKGPDP